MRRIEIIEGVNQVYNLIKESGLQEMITVMLRETPDTNKAGIILSVFKKYLRGAAEFNDAAKEIIKIFKIENLESSEFWSRIYEGTIEGDKDVRSVLYSLHRSFELLSFLPDISKLLTHEKVLDYQSAIEREKSVVDLLTLILVEENNQVSNPRRIITVLESIELLYGSSIILLESNVTLESLSVIACDSGSDKSFDFLGAAKIIEQVKEIIIGLWDRIVFFRERQMSERIDLVAKTLPVIEKIGIMEENEKIGMEQAEILRKNITRGVEGLINSGAIIPELDARSYNNPRLLMAPAPKLITAPTIVEEEIAEDEQSEGDDIEEQVDMGITRKGEGEKEELETIRKMLERIEKSYEESEKEEDISKGERTEAKWHSKKSKVHHNNPECTTGNNIEEENRRSGTGDKPLCQVCNRLNKE